MLNRLRPRASSASVRRSPASSEIRRREASNLAPAAATIKNRVEAHRADRRVRRTAGRAPSRWSAGAGNTLARPVETPGHSGRSPSRRCPSCGSTGQERGEMRADLRVAPQQRWVCHVCGPDGGERQDAKSRCRKNGRRGSQRKSDSVGRRLIKRSTRAKNRKRTRGC